MRILNQSKDFMINLEKFKGLTVKIGEKKSVHAVINSNHGPERVCLGEYSSDKKALAVLMLIFEHTGKTFIMPQDDEVEA